MNILKTAKQNKLQYKEPIAAKYTGRDYVR